MVVRPWAARTLLVLALGVAGTRGAAQVVRGTVRADGSGQPLAGVLVSLYRAGTPGADTARLVATLSTPAGEFALSAPGTGGPFVVVAKRIGVTPFRSAPFSLAAGETHRLEVALAEVRMALPAVTVSATTPCGRRAGDRGRIASLWEEARTALAASEVSLRDRLYHAAITRYQRALEPRALTVRRETRATRRGVTDRAFVSVPAESLAAHGYARVLPDGMIEYFAPDERVLLSALFVRDHCFALAQDAAPDEVGLRFEPVGDRRVADIAGTVWMDARSYELRRLTFQYTNFPLPVEDARVGGEVRFARTTTGAWHVARWWMRVPRVEVQRVAAGSPDSPRLMTQRPVILEFTEDGGDVAIEGTGPRLATLAGRAMDSTGRRPLREGRVSLAGTALEGDVGRDGTFRLQGIPGGSYTLLLDHPDYAALGLVAGEQVLDVAEGSTSTTALQAVGTRQVLQQLCGFDAVPDSATVLRLALPTAADSGGRVVHLAWTHSASLGGGVARTRTMAADLPVDVAGGVTACAMPRDRRVQVEERVAGRMVRRWEVTAPARGMALVRLPATP